MWKFQKSNCCLSLYDSNSVSGSPPNDLFNGSNVGGAFYPTYHWFAIKIIYQIGGGAWVWFD